MADPSTTIETSSSAEFDREQFITEVLNCIGSSLTNVGEGEHVKADDIMASLLKANGVVAQFLKMAKVLDESLLLSLKIVVNTSRSLLQSALEPERRKEVAEAELTRFIERNDLKIREMLAKAAATRKVVDMLLSADGLDQSVGMISLLPPEQAQALALRGHSIAAGLQAGAENLLKRRLLPKVKQFVRREEIFSGVESVGYAGSLFGSRSGSLNEGIYIQFQNEVELNTSMPAKEKLSEFLEGLGLRVKKVTTVKQRKDHHKREKGHTTVIYFELSRS